jgi:hypothetical protein
MDKQTSQPTEIVVRVIAKDGKFLGDDIGGALVTLRDVQTGELLACISEKEWQYRDSKSYCNPALAA